MKRFVFLLFVFCFIFGCFIGCQGKENYSKYPFVDIEWTRTTETDTEFIYFGDEGEFSYYCACGNPVNDSDLCEGYSYDESTKTIILNYSEKTKESITKVLLEQCSDTELILNFNGDMRTFKIEALGEEKDKITFENKTYTIIEFNSDIFNYDLTTGIETYEEDEIYKIPHNNWDIIYYNGDLFALDSDIENITSYYNSDKNYTWWVRVENIDLETLRTTNLSLTNFEIDYINNLDNMKRDETIFFEEIENFAILAKTSNDGLITATTELVWRNNCWYWRSEIIDEQTKGWPEYIIKLSPSLNDKISNP